MSTFTLRPALAGDGPAIAALLAASADGGRYQMSSRFRIDPWVALGALHGDFEGVVAEAPGRDGLAGVGLVRFDARTFEGVVRPHALLNTLVVHPECRGRGLAGELAAWRIERARARNGDDGVIFAGIQSGNVASVKNARRWSKQLLTGVLGVRPTPPRRGAPGARSPYAVRPAGANDWEPIADGLRSTYAGFNFRPPENASELAAWHAESPFDTPYRHALVIEDAARTPLAGLSLTEGARLRDMRMLRMPRAMAILNGVLRLFPQDGVLRELSVSHLWMRARAEDAARRLWDVVRWEWRDRGSVFLLWMDPRSGLERALPRAPWMPHSTGMLAVAGPVDADPERCVHPL
jgi:GNAT superfamily N-acetyltransferase